MDNRKERAYRAHAIHAIHRTATIMATAVTTYVATSAASIVMLGFRFVVVLA
jgi:hypothetical protein